jgi:hypothetical protein
MRSPIGALVVLVAILGAGAPGEALDARTYWPNFDAVARGYHLQATDGSTFSMWFVAIPGTSNFAMRGDESGCNMDYYTYAHGWLWLLYSLFTCDGAWIEQWYARPPNFVPQEVEPAVGPLSSGVSTKIFVARDGLRTGGIQTKLWQTYVTAIGPEGIRMVAEQVWHDEGGQEIGAIRETFLIGEVPLCQHPDQTMPGVRRYTAGTHRTTPETIYRDAELCWAK